MTDKNETLKQLKTSLVGIKGMVELLKDTELTEQQTIIVESLHRAASLLITKTDSQVKNNDYLDLDVVFKLIDCDQDDEFFLKLVEGFIKDGESHINYLQNPTEKSYTKYKDSLLALKGSSMEIGAKLLVEACIEGLEINSEVYGSTQNDKFIKKLDQIFHNTTIELQSLSSGKTFINKI